MPRCIILATAEADLDRIWEFIARDSPDNEDLFVGSIHEFCTDTLGCHPMMSRSRSELDPELRSFQFRNYTIFYRPIDAGVEIFHIYDGHRDLDALIN